jgi:hypothetical protein
MPRFLSHAICISQLLVLGAAQIQCEDHQADDACAQTMLMQVETRLVHEEQLQREQRVPAAILTGNTGLHRQHANISAGHRRHRQHDPTEDLIKAEMSSTPVTGSLGLAWSYVAFLLVYAVMCVTYSYATTNSDAEKSVEATSATSDRDKPRYLEWDFIKFVLHFCVVTTHMMEFTLSQNGNARLTVLLEPWFKWYMNFPVSFMMSGFAIISGVFGHGVSRKGLARCLCYTLGTAFLTTTIVNCLFLIPRSQGGPLYWKEVLPMHPMGLTWYLGALAVWRFTVSPLFHFGSLWEVHVAVPFVLTCVLSFVGWRTLPGLVGSTPFASFLISSNTFVFAPFFALGQLMPMSRWTNLLRVPALICIAVAFAFTWYLALFFSPWFRDWNQVACLGNCGEVSASLNPIDVGDSIATQLCVKNRHFPNMEGHASAAITFNLVMVDVLNFALKASISVAMLFTISAPLRPFMHFAPNLASIVLGSGTRTLYGYILHWVVIVDLAETMDFHLITNEIPEALLPWFCILFTLFLVLILTSAFTERILSWLIMPLWLMNLCPCAEKEDKKAAAQSALTQGPHTSETASGKPAH